MAWACVRRGRTCRIDVLTRMAENFAAADTHRALSCTTFQSTLCAWPGHSWAPTHRPAAIYGASQLTSLRHFSFSSSRLQKDEKKEQSLLNTHKIEPVGGWSYEQVVNLPNAISMARLLSGPLIAFWVVQGKWSFAVPGLAISGASDWLDGYFARRSGQHSVLGSYLDPLADKILIGCVVGALGYTGALPLPLVGVIVGRDVVLVGGAFVARAKSLHWKWPGTREFFRIAPASAPATVTGGNNGSTIGSNNGSTPAAPLIKPFLVSKVNTGLQIALVASCMTDAWLGWPGMDTVWSLGAATAGTTVWSCVSYARAYMRGELEILKGGAGR